MQKSHNQKRKAPAAKVRSKTRLARGGGLRVKAKET